MSQPEEIRVRDALTTEPRIINGMATISEALGIMSREGLSALIIDKRTSEDEYGLITMSMIAKSIYASKRNPARVSVYEVMEKPVVNLPASMQVRYALRLMCRLEQETALVSDDKNMLGCVTLSDLTLAEFLA